MATQHVETTERTVTVPTSRRHLKVSSLLPHLALLCGVVISIFPFYWLIVMATNTTSAIYSYPPTLTFGTQLVTNITHVMASIDFFGSFVNTFIVAVCTMVLVLFFDSLAGFTFAKFEFPGKKALFLVLLATFMVPAQLSVVPLFVMMAHLKWVGGLQALIIPGAANAFGIFWMRQYADGAIHPELLDAGRMDGCGHFRLYWNVGLPILRPALAFLGIFTFIYAWNDYLWPLIVLVNPRRLTLQVALSQLNGVYSTDYGMVMAGTLLATLPLIIIFLVGSRQFIGDIAAGAIK
jgi:cellobiose transport system permease protein